MLLILAYEFTQFIGINAKRYNLNYLYDCKSFVMQESKRQKQVAKLILEEMNQIFQRVGLTMVDGGMVSISKVTVTPDLLEARVYLSLFQVKEPESVVQGIVDRTSELRNLLGRGLRHQLRRIPELKFFNDDTLDHVFKMEELLKSVRKEDNSDKE